MREIPVLRMLREPIDAVRARARRLAELTGGEVVETTGRVGGGALPLLDLPSAACALRRRPDGGAPRGADAGDRGRARRPDAARLPHDRVRRDRRRRRGGPRLPLSAAAAHARNGRPHRSRQDPPRRGADRHGHRPAARGEATRDLDRARLRATRARRTARRLSVIDVPGPRPLRAHDGRGRDRDRPVPARRRRGGGPEAADATSTSRSCGCSASTAASSPSRRSTRPTPERVRATAAVMRELLPGQRDRPGERRDRRRAAAAARGDRARSGDGPRGAATTARRASTSTGSSASRAPGRS